MSKNILQKNKILEYSISQDTAQAIANELRTLGPGDTLEITLPTEQIKIHVITIKIKYAIK